jgi:hypothetical protein
LFDRILSAAEIAKMNAYLADTARFNEVP